MFLYKETALFLEPSFWLHQWGIPRHTYRFYCCLAAHQRTRKKDSAEPSFPILWTPPHPPGVIRCGGEMLAAAGLYQFRYLYSGAVVTPQFRIWFGCLCSVLYRSRFSRVVGLWSFVFHYWGIGRSYLRLLVVLQWSFVGFALTANGSFVSAGNGMG